MGKLFYGANRFEVELDDELLAHLKSVMLAKLRREEKFAFSWETEACRHTLWFHPSVELYFELPATPMKLNRVWIERLSQSANSGDGLRALPEPATSS